MNKPHIHAALIKAWADGAEIQLKDKGEWLDIQPYGWYCDREYRVKPEPKPDIVLLGWIESNGEKSAFVKDSCIKDNLKLTFDGETGKLKAAEVL